MQFGYCMQALVQIGSNAAMQQLVDYAKARFDPKEERSSRISQALGRGYDAFAREPYIRQVLAHAQFLDLRGNAIQDLSPLSSLSQLQTLSLRGTQVHDFTPLTRLTQKVQLLLNQSQVEAAAPLKAMKNWQIINF